MGPDQPTSQAQNAVASGPTGVAVDSERGTSALAFRARRKWLGVGALVVLLIGIAAMWEADQPPSGPPVRLTDAAAAASLLELSPVEVASRARNGTVQIVGLDAAGTEISEGTGFFVSVQGLIATNFHVISGAHALEIRTLAGESYDAVSLVATDVARDLALLQVAASNVLPLPLASGAAPAIGAPVYAMGNPLGQVGTFSSGLVSAQRLVDGVPLLQITAPISPGSSGGPVLNNRGEVIGVATLYMRGGQNLNYAVPSGELRQLLQAGGHPEPFSYQSVAAIAATAGHSAAAWLDQKRTSNAQGSAPTPPDAVVRWQFLRVDSAIHAQGYEAIGGIAQGALAAGESESRNVETVPGTEYAIVGFCDADCKSFKLGLHTSSGALVTVDSTDDRPSLVFLAYSGVNYVLTATMLDCQSEKCGYGLRMYRKGEGLPN